MSTRRRDTRRSRERAIRRRQMLLAGTAFAVAQWATLGATWPSLPFPAAEGLLALCGLGLAFGTLIGRPWAIVLAVCGGPVAGVVTGSVWGALAGLFVTGPVSVVALAVGVSLRRMRRPAPAAAEEASAGRARAARPPLVPQGS